MLNYLAIAFALIVVLLAATWYFRRQRLDIWQQWARLRNLTYLAPPAGPKITGSVGEHRVSVESEARGSDAEGPVEIVRFIVVLNGEVPELDVEGIPGLIGDLAQLGENRIETGDTDFDRDVIVRRSDDEQALIDFWSPARRTAFLNLVQGAPCDQVLIKGRSLIGEERSIMTRSSHLDELADALLAAAKILDGKKDA